MTFLSVVWKLHCCSVFNKSVLIELWKENLRQDRKNLQSLFLSVLLVEVSTWTETQGYNLKHRLQILIDHMWAKALKFLTNTEFTFIRHVSASTQQLVSDDLVRLCDLLFPFVTDGLKHLRAGLKVSHS